MTTMRTNSTGLLRACLLAALAASAALCSVTTTLHGAPTRSSAVVGEAAGQNLDWDELQLMGNAGHVRDSKKPKPAFRH